MPVENTSARAVWSNYMEPLHKVEVLFYDRQRDFMSQVVHHTGRLFFDTTLIHCELWADPYCFSYTWEGACYSEKYPENWAARVPIYGIDTYEIVDRHNQWANCRSRLSVIDCLARSVFGKAHGPLCTDYVLSLLGLNVDQISLTPSELHTCLLMTRHISHVPDVAALTQILSIQTDTNTASLATPVAETLTKVGDMYYQISSQLQSKVEE